MVSPPPEIGAIVALLIVALMLLGWRMHLMLHGSRAKLRRRLAAITGAGPAESEGRARVPRRQSLHARLKVADDSRGQARGHRLREQLRLAGLSFGLSRYLAINAALAGTALILAKSVGLGWPIAGAGAIIVGFGLPKLLVGMMAKRRVRRFGTQFPDALDIIVRGIRSGLPLSECIAAIAREMPDPIGAEFRRIIESQRLGMALYSAVARAVVRMPMPDLRYFAIVIAIQQQTGGNLAETLAKLSDVLRARKRMRDKITAYASEARASATIIGSLPLVVILALVAVAPNYVGLLFSTDLGNLLLAIGGLTELGGLLVMRNMINFDI